MNFKKLLGLFYKALQFIGYNRKNLAANSLTGIGIYIGLNAFSLQYISTYAL